MAIDPSTIVTDDVREKLLGLVRKSIHINSGRGNIDGTFESILSKFDRFGTAPVQLNSEMVGLTFFTRPRLNMTTQSIRQDPTLAILDTLDPLSWMFSLRCNLDSVFSKTGVGQKAAITSPFFNEESPFNIPMSNLLLGISGFPDFNVEYKTTESGYFAEDMTMARGADWGRRTYNINCTFRDIQGGYLMAYFYYWIIAMALQMEGTIVPYSDDREANRLNYTCSIYRFVLDPSLRTIVKWAKATGCYPVTIPIGDSFNFNPGDSYVHGNNQFNIQFVANHVRYMDPRQLEAFNTLADRYASGGSVVNGRKKVEVDISNNFKGLPYVDIRSGRTEMQFWATPEELEDTTQKDIDDLVRGIDERTKAFLSSRQAA